MYYSNRQDINKFRPDVACNLSMFYQDVLTAETERQTYMYYDKMVERDPDDTALEENRDSVLHALFEDMRGNINSSRQRIPELKTETGRDTGIRKLVADSIPFTKKTG